MFSNTGIQDWETEYGVSLKKPNKRYSIAKEDVIIRVTDYLKNIWTVRRYFIETFGIDPPIINGIKCHYTEMCQVNKPP